MPNGYSGQILRVNLTRGTTSIETPDENFYRAHLGGRGLIAHYLLKELKPGVDPLGPENKVIFATGLLTGAPVAGSGRNSVGAKSPLSGGYGDAEAGGFFGPELKRAGFDAVIIEGRAKRPVYLWVHDGQAELRDAAGLWGKRAYDVEQAIRAELGDNGIRVAQCGVGGENRVRFACVSNDVTHFYGRGGIGAVMGAKNLKAVAARGHAAYATADPERVKEMGRAMTKHITENEKGFTDLGTTGTVAALSAAGGLPTRNFRDGSFEGAKKIDGTTMRDTLLVGRDSCYACAVHCKRVVERKPGEGHYVIDRNYGGPEYEALAALGSLCGVDDLEAVCKASELCNAYVLDAISTGAAIAFAMECYENGILSKKDTGGLDLRFGNGQALVQMVEDIAHRRGLGELLAEGVARAAEKLGPRARKFAIHVRGQELPMHEPRLKMGLGIGYTISPTGADHCHNIHDTMFVKRVESIKPLGILETMPATDLSPRKVKTLKRFTDLKHTINSLGLCQFVSWDYSQQVELLQAVTGWTTSLLELSLAGERAANLARVFNVREGLTAAGDRLPDRFFQGLGNGAIAGTKMSPKLAEAAKGEYYAMMGWDRETGRPSEAKLDELGIEWAAAHLPKAKAPAKRAAPKTKAPAKRATAKAKSTSRRATRSTRRKTA
ncbi:MAG: aldehyde ferredoxin oxidoreductase family protein [Bacillota bacterium]